MMNEGNFVAFVLNQKPEGIWFAKYLLNRAGNDSCRLQVDLNNLAGTRLARVYCGPRSESKRLTEPAGPCESLYPGYDIVVCGGVTRGGLRPAWVAGPPFSWPA
jgi:hypothetical protein